MNEEPNVRDTNEDGRMTCELAAILLLIDRLYNNDQYRMTWDQLPYLKYFLNVVGQPTSLVYKVEPFGSELLQSQEQLFSSLFVKNRLKPFVKTLSKSDGEACIVVTPQAKQEAEKYLESASLWRHSASMWRHHVNKVVHLLHGFQSRDGLHMVQTILQRVEQLLPLHPANRILRYDMETTIRTTPDESALDPKLVLT